LKNHFRHGVFLLSTIFQSRTAVYDMPAIDNPDRAFPVLPKRRKSGRIAQNWRLKRSAADDSDDLCKIT